MTMAYVLRSRMTRKCHVRFCSGSEVGDCFIDHNQPTRYTRREQRYLACVSYQLGGMPCL